MPGTAHPLSSVHLVLGIVAQLLANQEVEFSNDLDLEVIRLGLGDGQGSVSFLGKDRKGLYAYL